jgi:hybrid polyketide synthase/nonribosomal peptide synthetase ACE1
MYEGAGTGAATMHILRETRANFDRYVFTDISKGFFDSAQTLFKEVPRMVFKTFDIEISPTQQGFDDSSFDMIVASNVVHATKSIEQTLRNIRRLLKPGGYLAMLEITDNGPIRSGFVFGSLPGWWLGVDDGRSMSPLISPSDWDTVLRRTGFSGVDTITPQTHTLPYPGSGFISQAVDDRIEFLRQPMQSRAHNLHQSQFADQLVLLGGSPVKSASFIETLISELGPYFGSVSHVKDLAEFGELNVCTDAAILSIAELDGALFEGITTEIFDAFKSILEPGRIIQWITRGRNDQEPYANMTVGFCRSQLLEVPGVSLQFLDFANDEEFSIDTLLRSFLQFCASVRWELDLSSRYLYSIEPEISIVHGRQEILRLVPNTDQNNRFNSSYRSISQTLGSCDVDVRLISDGNGLKLMRCPSQPPQTGDDDEGEVSVTVTCASLSPIRIRSMGAFYIALGTEEDSNTQLLCLSQVHGPHLRIPRLLVVPCTFSVENAPDILLRIIYNVVADTVLDLNTRGTILVQDPPSQFAMALERSSNERLSNVSFISSTPKCPLGTSWKFIHPRSSQRSLERELPRNVRYYLNCSKSSDSLKVSELVQQTLTGDYGQATLETFCSQYPFFEESNLATISPVLESFISYLATEGDNISGESGVNILSPRNTIRVTQSFDPFSVMRWDDYAGIEIPVRPVDERPLFKEDSTYWLVGLTQSLGLSLCEWMIRKGARNVVLSSRNPHVDNRWTEKMRALGATIKISANDISDKASVQALYDEILCTMPPIAGVAHGAMVLRDCLVKDMSLADLQSVIVPKVEGAKILDQIFHDQQLDFFILFSSMATVVGNVGQSNYTAANAFLTSLSAKRRKRGVAASVINIGAILGVGYVTEQLNTTYHKKLRDGGHTWMSEHLFHQTFAEGVLASAINSTEHCQISTGLRYVTHSDPDPPFWYDNPKFSHHIIQDDTTETGNDLETMQGLPIQTQLAQASSQSQVLEILETQLLAKLRNILQMDDQGNYTDETILQRSMSALGVDSLIAVDIRSWFMKSCNVNVPVLQILGGTSVRDLLEYAMNNLPSGVTGVDEIKIVGGSSAPESYIARQNTGPDDDSIASPERTSPQKSQSPSICTDESPNNSEGSDLTSYDDNTVSTSSVDYSPVRTAPMSRTQSLFWFVNNYLDDSMSLNHSGLYRIKGSIRPIDLQSAVETVAQRHEILRTAFVQNQQGEVMQEVMESAQLILEMRTVESEKDVWDELLIARQYAFDPICGRTMRMTLLTLSAKMHYLVFSCHPIILDGTSQLIFMTDLEKAYDGKRMAPVLQFIDLTTEQISAEENGTWDAELQYWADEFSVLPPTLELFPFCKHRTRKPLGSYAVCRLDARIDAGLNFKLRRACSKLDSTPFQVHLAVLRVLLSQLSGNEHICIGTAEANRYYPPEMSAIGPYMNILPLRFESSGYSTFATILRDTRQKVLGAMSNSRVPFELILKEVNAPRSATHTPLFQALIDYRQGTKEKQPWSDCELEFLNFDTGRHGYDVGLDIIDNPGSDCLLTWTTQESLYGSEEVALISSCYIHLLSSFVQDSQYPLHEIDVYPPEARNTAFEYGRGMLSSMVRREGLT